SSLLISGATAGAILTDGSNTHTFSGPSDSFDIHSWNLSALTIKPANDTNFTLTVTATEQDSDNPANTSTATATEAVTVNPLAPTVTWGGTTSGSASGTEGTGTPIALQTIAYQVNSLSGDNSNNSLKSLVVTGTSGWVGNTLTDGTVAHTVL